MRRRGLSVAASFAAALTIASVHAPSARAHDTDPSVKTVLDSVTPTVDGVVVQVVDSVTAELVVENPTATELDVLADTGEPFLRISASGVQANLASASWYESNQPFGGPLPPGVAIDPSAPPRWATVAAQPSWGWFDHRLHPATVAADPGRRWSVPIRYGSTAGAIAGHLERRSFTGSYTSRLVAGAQPFAGVTVQVLDGRLPGLLLRNDSPAPVTVLGAAGEPFAVIGPDGVQVNAHSPTWIASAQAQGLDVSQDDADPSVAPTWQALSPATTFSWLEPRGRYPGDEPPPAAAAARVATVVLDWSVPLEQSGTTSSVRLVTAWVPAPPVTNNPSSTAPAVVAAVIAAPIAAMVALIVVLRRRANRRSSS